MTTVLIVEDDARLLATLEIHLREAGYQTAATRTADQAEHFLEQHPGADLVLLDVRLPGRSGVDLIESLKKHSSLPPTILMSGEATMTETLRALELGVLDFLEKPFRRERLLRSIDLALEVAGLRDRVDATSTPPLDRILGDSPAVHDLKTGLEKAARSNARVLIQGESGTGKELVAEALHAGSQRSNGPFIRLNCGAIPGTLIEDELFGHKAGAFTDAKQPRPGLFELAHQGTLFLDEIGDLQPDLQSRLLRVIEDGRVRRLGETEERRVDVRVLAATHRDLEQGSFRHDLFYRLAELRLRVPPLRERGSDIELLFHHFLRLFCAEHRSRHPEVSPSLLAHLNQHTWPGNVRELKNVCQHLAVFGKQPLQVSDLPSGLMSASGRGPLGLLKTDQIPVNLSLKEFKRECEREFLEQTLRRCDWNFTRAAAAIQVQRTHLHDRARKLGISRRNGNGQGG